MVFFVTQNKRTAKILARLFSKGVFLPSFMTRVGQLKLENTSAVS